MRSLQLYAPAARREEYGRAVARAAAWIAKAEPVANEERAFKLLGLGWSRAPKPAIDKAARALVATQAPDGGWPQLASLPSDAYATGQSLYALRESGALAPDHPAFRKGVQFLLNSQLADGTWLVRSRAIAIQPLFDIGFPHGRDSWISAAGTNWATLALSAAIKTRS
jgi:squalene cyclase